MALTAEDRLNQIENQLNLIMEKLTGLANIDDAAAFIEIANQEKDILDKQILAIEQAILHIQYQIEEVKAKLIL